METKSYSHIHGRYKYLEKNNNNTLEQSMGPTAGDLIGSSFEEPEVCSPKAKIKLKTINFTILNTVYKGSPILFKH